jgi:chorismate mutase
MTWTRPAYDSEIEKLRNRQRALSEREHTMIQRERRLLKKPFLNQETIEKMYETVTVLFA